MLPVACNLADPELARRNAEVRTVLCEAQTMEPLAAGYRWRFATTPQLLSRLALVIEAERQCCRFLTFHFHADADLGEVVLDVTGPDATKAFLSDWLE